MKLKKYQVVFVDEYNNWWLIGFFDNLIDAEPELNSMLKDYKMIDDDGEEVECQFGNDTLLGHLEEYPSTFSMCFDRIIEVSEGCVEVRGFIFNEVDE